MLELVQCFLCGSDNFRHMYRLKERLLYREKFNVVQCRKCGMIYTNPRPQESNAGEYYPSGYSPFQYVYPDLLFPQDNSGARKIKNWLKRAVLNIHYGYFGKSKKSGIMRILTLPIKYNIGWIFPKYKENGRVLDIGCSTGVYLAKLRELGWDCYGVEISRKAADWGKNKLGLKIVTGTAEQVLFPEEYFDAVTMWHVLEHVYSPEKTIKEVYKVLRKGGVFIVGIPNAGSIERKFFGRWWGEWHFSPKTIKLFLLKNNFKSIKIEYLPNVNNIILSLQNFFLDIFPSKRNLIKSFYDPDKNPRLREALKIIGYILSCLRQSGRIVIYAKK